MKTRLNSCWQLVALALALALGGCVDATLPPLPGATVTSAETLRAYASPTPTPTLAPALRSPTPTPIPQPTPTPFIYKVNGDDTMLGVAIHFGITLQALKTANPTVNPNFMSVGQPLVIPLPEQTTTPTPTGQAPDVRLGAPRCYSGGSSGTWCLVMLENRSEKWFTQVQVGLVFSGTQELQAAPVLERLAPRIRIPVSFFFSQPGLNGSQASTRLVSAQTGPDEDPRYVGAKIIESQVEFAPDGLSAHLTGRVQLNGPASKLWIVAAGFTPDLEIGRDGLQPVTVRRWEIKTPCGALAAATPQPSPTPVETAPVSCAPAAYDFVLYSLGPALNQVEIYAEASR